MKKLLVTLVFMAFATSSVFAFKPFVEPYGGAGMLSSKSELSGTEFETSGLQYGIGARAGIGYDMFFAGVDLNYLIGTDKLKKVDGVKVDPAPDADKTTQMNVGLIAGIELPILPLRFWGGYNLMNSLKAKDSDDDESTMKGSAMKFGVGFKVIPLLSINAEYIMNTFKKYKVADGDFVDLGDDDKSKMNTIFVSISAPISF